MESRDPRNTFAWSRTLFLRVLALAYLAAFVSFAVQARGLVGARGILPAGEWLAGARDVLGPVAWLQIPTLFWWNTSDAALVGIPVLGALLAVALGLGLAPRWTALGAWGLYLSIVHIGQVFLGYQWDALLLEAGLLAIWLAPGGWRPHPADPPRAPLFLLRWLLFRLFLLSGLVKLLSGDPTWRHLTAMEFHYWTQPLPTWTSPFFYALPTAFHRVETGATLAVELGLPFAVFGPRRARLAAAAGLAALQILINVSGNYGFFGLVTLALCALLVDDAVWSRLPGLRARQAPAAAPAAPPLWRTAVAAAAVALTVAVTSALAILRVAPGLRLPTPLAAAARVVAPLDAFHAYGLFAVMTTDRLEIEIEGSRDGKSWRAYDFRWKPDRLDERPRFATPHMPRLDWQLWFAALEPSCTRVGWFLAFERRLLQASPPVLGLLARDPFPGERPREIRATLWRYRFADAATGRGRSAPARGWQEGRWWRRERIGPYCPALTLEDGSLRVVSP